MREENPNSSSIEAEAKFHCVAQTRHTKKKNVVKKKNSKRVYFKKDNISEFSSK